MARSDLPCLVKPAGWKGLIIRAHTQSSFQGDPQREGPVSLDSEALPWLPVDQLLGQNIILRVSVRLLGCSPFDQVTMEHAGITGPCDVCLLSMLK